MEAETIEKENYRRTSGVQEVQWSKGNNPILTPPNFIETNLMTITDKQFMDAIAQRYGVSREDLFPEYLTRTAPDGMAEKQSRVMLRQIENILTQEKRYRFVIQGDSEEQYIYPLDGFEITEESVVQATSGEAKEVEVTGNIYQERAKMLDRYTQKSYTILEGARDELQIAELVEDNELEILDAKPFVTESEQKIDRQHRGEEYYTADLEFPMKAKEKEQQNSIEEIEPKQKNNWFEGISLFFHRVFGKNKLKELPAPNQRKKGLQQYQLDPKQYSLPPERMSDIAKQRLLEDLKHNGRRGEAHEIDQK